MRLFCGMLNLVRKERWTFEDEKSPFFFSSAPPISYVFLFLKPEIVVLKLLGWQRLDATSWPSETVLPDNFRMHVGTVAKEHLWSYSLCRGKKLCIRSTVFDKGRTLNLAFVFEGGGQELTEKHFDLRILEKLLESRCLQSYASFKKRKEKQQQ